MSMEIVILLIVLCWVLWYDRMNQKTSTDQMVFTNDQLITSNLIQPEGDEGYWSDQEDDQLPYGPVF